MRQHTHTGLLIIVLVLGGLLLPQLAWMQASDATGFIGCEGLRCTLNDLTAIPGRIFNWAVAAAAAVFFGIIVFSGVRIGMFYVNEAPEAELQAAKNTLRHGIVGFLIVVLAYLIVTILLFNILGLTGPVADELGNQGIER